jgi:hypothetical protein
MNTFFAPWFDHVQQKVIIAASLFIVIASITWGFWSVPLVWKLYSGGTNPYVYILMAAAGSFISVMLFCIAAGTSLLAALFIGICGVCAFVGVVLTGTFVPDAFAGLLGSTIFLFLPSIAIMWILGHHRI